MQNRKSDEAVSHVPELPQVQPDPNRVRRPGSKLILIGTVGILLTFVIVKVITHRSRTDSTLRTADVRRDSLVVTVTESGTLAARKSIMYTCKMHNMPSIIRIVPEGTYITPEDVNNRRVLVELDPSIAQEKLAPQQMNLLQVQADITQAKEDYDIQLTQNESDITAARLAADFAWMDFERYVGMDLSGKIRRTLESDPNAMFDPGSWLGEPNELGGAAGQTYSQLHDAITLARARLKRAQDVLESTRKLYDVDYVSLMSLEGDELQVNSNKIQLQHAQAELDLFKQYDFSKQAKRLLSSYQEALRGLTRTYARARARKAQAQSQIASRKSRLKWVQGEIKKQERQIKASTIRATAPGLLVYGSERDIHGNVKVEICEGAKVRYNQKIITLPDTSEMIARVGVHESTVDKVRKGQKATITVDAFPDQIFHGEVLRVASLPEQQSLLSSDIKVYTTEISIEGFYDFLKPGMSAKVEIVVKHLNDVLVVPIQAVANRAHKKECYVLGRSGPESREVVIGAFNQMSVQIVEGLSTGEDVLLNPPWRFVETLETKTAPKRTGDPEPVE